MRYLLPLAFAALLTSCISTRKHEDYIAVATALHQQQLDSIRMLQDSTLRMRLAVERARGREDAFLASQDKYLARLAEQEEQLDQLQGNLSSTNAQMSKQLAELRRELAESGARYDTLVLDQNRIITAFQDGIDDAAALLLTMLEGKIDSLAYAVTTGPGTATLSVQEDLLFKPRTVDKAQDEAAFVLRAVTETLLDDPLLKLTIVGHTDNQPNPRRGTDNWAYAALRAAFLADELTQTYYLSPNRLIAASHGEYGPITSNASEEGRKMNRRIDFVFRNNVGNLLRELEKLGQTEDEK